MRLRVLAVFALAILLIVILLAMVCLKPSMDANSLPVTDEKSTALQGDASLSPADTEGSAMPAAENAQADGALPDSAILQPSQPAPSLKPLDTAPTSQAPPAGAPPGAPASASKNNSTSASPSPVPSGNAKTPTKAATPTAVASSTPGVTKKSLNDGTMTMYNTGLGLPGSNSGNTKESTGSAALKSIGVTPLLDAAGQSGTDKGQNQPVSIMSSQPQSGSSIQLPSSSMPGISPGKDIDKLFNSMGF